MVSNVTLGRGAKIAWVWGWVLWDVTEEEGDWFSDALSITSGIIATSFITNPALTFNATGIVTRAIISNPVVQAITVATVTGAIISDQIDPENGFDNYVGFITGGNRGTEDIHYYSGDANDSGYFNVLRNAEIIGEHYGPKVDQAISNAWEGLQRRLFQKPSWI
jgi:hypothetical protein